MSKKIKEKTKVLPKREENFCDLSNYMLDVVGIVDWSGKVLFVNKAGAAMVGLKTPREFIGLNVLEFIHPDFKSSAIKDLQLIKNERRGKSLDYRQYKIRTRAGEDKWVEGIGTKIHFGEGSADLIALRDITDRKEMEDELNKYHNQLEDMVKKRTDELRKTNKYLEAEIRERAQVEEKLREREEELVIKSKMLEEANASLRILLNQRQKDKDELEEQVLSNIKELVIPLIETLKRSATLDAQNAAYISLIESNLKDIVSPFSRKLSAYYLNLTPKELQVANLVREGKPTRDIAKLMNVCEGAIELHRNRLRKKLGLTNRKINLRTYLSSLS
jgi:PAS domain S-box-containing protein